MSARARARVCVEVVLMHDVTVQAGAEVRLHSYLLVKLREKESSFSRLGKFYPRWSMNRTADGPHSRSGRNAEETKNILLHQRIEPRLLGFSARSLVTAPRTLVWLLVLSSIIVPTLNQLAFLCFDFLHRKYQHDGRENF
jgi:hypothetical protein